MSLSTLIDMNIMMQGRLSQRMPLLFELKLHVEGAHHMYLPRMTLRGGAPGRNRLGRKGRSTFSQVVVMLLFGVCVCVCVCVFAEEEVHPRR